MPAELVLVRHGESEGNVVHGAGKHGDFSLETEAYAEKLSSEWRLTERGIEQAQAAGAWIREQIGTDFRRAYTSRFLRARETAGHLGLDLSNWYLSQYIHERNWGILDQLSQEQRHAPEFDRTWQIRKERPLDWRPLDGESIIDMCQRLKVPLDTISREADGQRVIMVCHGEVIRTYRLLLEHMKEPDFVEWVQSSEERDKIHNGEVVQYTRRVDPEDPESELAEHLEWRRSVCPWDPDLSRNEWERIVRPKYSDIELIEGVEYSPRVVD